MHQLSLTLCAAMIGFTAAAGAQELFEVVEIGDVTLELQTLADMSQRLLVGERLLSADDHIVVGEQMAFGDGFVRLLNVGSGGSVCSGALQILWSVGQRVEVSDKTDPCLYPDVAHLGDALELRVKPLPAQPGAVWRWTSEGGLQPLPERAFTPEPGQNWDSFPAFANSHPIDMLSFAPIYHQFSAALSPQDFETLALTLNQLGSGTALSEGYEGEVCAKWECEARFAYLWVDLAAQQAYAFWRVEDQEFASPLPLADWPQWVVMRAAQKLEAQE